MVIPRGGDARCLMGAFQWKGKVQLVDKFLDSSLMARKWIGDTCSLLHVSQWEGNIELKDVVLHGSSCSPLGD
jgi:hypothetical protein